jgi:hypothetical protein
MLMYHLTTLQLAVTCIFFNIFLGIDVILYYITSVLWTRKNTIKTR